MPTDDPNSLVSLYRWALGGAGLVIGGLLVTLWRIVRGDQREVKTALEACAKQKDVEDLEEKVDAMADEVKRVESEARERLENALTRIEDKIDSYEHRSSKTRHDIRDDLHTMRLELRVAIAGGTLPRREPI